MVPCAAGGNNANGQATVPNDLGPVTQVSVGVRHTCVVKTDSRARCWGNNAFGQAAVPADLGLVSQISAGRNATCAVTLDGTARCWGGGARPKQSWSGQPDRCLHRCSPAFWPR
ncbi:hypothetical protein [uncultured Chloroflexus sp.]|uniref:hypothetical protein n=1 Tax=Chloroflexus sp. TaxID=1904827 RepID=UPI00345D9EEA